MYSLNTSLALKYLAKILPERYQRQHCLFVCNMFLETENHSFRAQQCQSSKCTEGVKFYLKLIRNLAPVIVGPVSEIFNKMLETWVLPVDLKCCNISSIFKVRTSHLSTNYCLARLTGLLLSNNDPTHKMDKIPCNNSSKHYIGLIGRKLATLIHENKISEHISLPSIH